MSDNIGEGGEGFAKGQLSTTLILTGRDIEALLKAYRYDGYQDLTLNQLALGVFRLGLEAEKEDKGNERILANLSIKEPGV